MLYPCTGWEKIQLFFSLIKAKRGLWIHIVFFAYLKIEKWRTKSMFMNILVGIMAQLQFLPESGASGWIKKG